MNLKTKALVSNVKIQAGMTRFFSKAAALTRDSRFSLLPTLVILCLLVGEQYPFSSFPMYSSFSDSAYYVYLTDSLDRPIATQTKLGVSTTTLKKVYDSQLRKDARSLKKRIRELTPAEKAAAGGYLLSYIRSLLRARELPSGLRVYDVELVLKDGAIKKSTQLVAQTL